MNENFEKIPTLSAKEAIILDLLIHNLNREMYGLEIVKESNGKIKQGTVYVTLSRIEEKNYVTSRKETRRPGAIGLPRRLYRMTGFGLRVFRAWEMFAGKFPAEAQV